MLRLYIVRGFWLPTDLIQLKKADKILIMDNGKIIDYRNHYCLYKNNKYYCDLYDSYMNKYQEEEVK